MVGERQGLHAQFRRAIHQPVDAAGSVEQAVVAMDMEMDEILVGGTHRRSWEASPLDPASVKA